MGETKPVLPRRYHRLRNVLNRRQTDLTVLLEDVNKPHNFSAIIRTCDAVGVFSAHAVYEQGKVPAFSETAQGSQKWVNIHSHPDLQTAATHLKRRDFTIYAAHLSEKAVDYCTPDYTRPSAILFGAEKWGVSEEAMALADQAIYIPMLGMVQSLNVSVAAAVILFEAQRQRLAAGYYDQVRLDSETYHRTLFQWAYPELAAAYDKAGKPYPRLGDDGQIITHN
ncbi:MAG: tRNA (guanosine(18)-2'-O)-methyltransferase TrmH [Cyanobacteria bacterium SW_9_44_58]|nr:MAG: tRNA (guanosine(18)-2'-O)-methyltransferase TrmH [Cyanobacteria bacterium SW_9_44_58]